MDKFAFAIHPLDMEGVEKFEPKVKGKSPALVEKVIEWTPPFKLSEITGVRSDTGREISGYFIGCPLLPKHFIEWDREFSLDKVVKCAKLAEELGAKIIGLGAYTSVVGDGGTFVARRSSIAVTNGNSYTVAAALEGTKSACEKMGITLANARACVIGATGSVGQVCSKLLAREVGEITLIARNKRRLEELAESLKSFACGSVHTSLNPSESSKESDIVITATSSPFALLGPEDLKCGSVVCDVSRPRNISQTVATARGDVLVLDGGVIEVPGDADFDFDFGFPRKIAYACMSETMILTLEQRFENYSLGKNLTEERVLEIQMLAKKHGFKLAGFRSFDRPLSEQEIFIIKENARKKKALISLP